MFEQLFTRQAAIDRHHSSPFASERLSYLAHLMEQGHSDSRLYSVAHLLLAIARHLPLNRPGIDRAEIEVSAEAWARTTCRSALCLHTGKREFVFHATKWLRLLGRLHEPQRQQPFALETDAFLRHGQQDRGLASSTLDRYRRYLTEFLVRLYEQNKTLHDVTLDEISAHIQIVAQRKLKRTSIAHHVAALRAFFRYAHSRGWCRAGLAAIDAPRIYRLESLPRGPAWSDVQRLLAACAGNTPSEIRDHAMLLVIAVYGVRSGEVRSGGLHKRSAEDWGNPCAARGQRPECTEEMLYRSDRRHGLHLVGDRVAFQLLALRTIMRLCLGKRYAPWTNACSFCRAIRRKRCP